jgi:hypothetical protein
MALLGFLAMPALAHIQDENMNSEYNKWADRQINANGGGCCGAGEAHYVEDDHLRMVKGVFEVKIGDIWYPIEEWMRLKNSLTDPNPTGKPVVWYGPNQSEAGGVHIYCFAIPHMI